MEENKKTPKAKVVMQDVPEADYNNQLSKDIEALMSNPDFKVFELKPMKNPKNRN